MRTNLVAAAVAYRPVAWRGEKVTKIQASITITDQKGVKVKAIYGEPQEDMKAALASLIDECIAWKTAATVALPNLQSEL